MQTKFEKWERAFKKLYTEEIELISIRTLYAKEIEKRERRIAKLREKLHSIR